MKNIIRLTLVALVLAGCYKKSNELEKMNYHLGDKDYTGGKWFQFTEYTEHYPSGQTPYVKFWFEVNSEVVGPAEDFLRLNLDNGYSFDIPFNYTFGFSSTDFTIGTQRCFEVGIKDKHSADVLHVYQDCVTYDG